MRTKHVMRTVNTHPQYSTNETIQQNVVDGVEAQYHAILDLIEVVLHKRLTQFAECMAEALNKKFGVEDGGQDEHN